MKWRTVFTLGAALLATVSGAAHADFMPLPSQLVSPQEAALLPDLKRAQVEAEAKHIDASLAILDTVLSQMTSPTPFRGAVQMLRAELLQRSRRPEDAATAVEESIRLLPGYSGPLLSGFRIYTYNHREGDAVDLLLRATSIDPQIVRLLVTDYDLQAIVGRLDGLKDTRRVQALSERLLAIGWRGSLMGSRAELAQHAIDARVKEGRYAEARALLPEIIQPSQLYGMLADKRYEPLWPDIEKWGGPKLARAWSVYLPEARARWEASHSSVNAREYIKALGRADRDSEIAKTFFPVFTGPLDHQKDYELVFGVAALARSLGHLDRWADAQKVYDAAARFWSLGEDVNGLNVTANEANFLLSKGEASRALQLTQRSLEVADLARGEVNTDAIRAMHSTRVCALAELGRGAEAKLSLALATSSTNPELVATTYLCINDLAAAREALIASLRNEDQREDAIGVVQRPSLRTAPSAYDQKQRLRGDRLRADPAILGELAKVGRLLPFTLSDGAVGARPRKSSVKPKPKSRHRQG